MGLSSFHERRNEGQHDDAWGALEQQAARWARQYGVHPNSMAVMFCEARERIQKNPAEMITLAAQRIQGDIRRVLTISVTHTGEPVLTDQSVLVWPPEVRTEEPQP